MLSGIKKILLGSVILSLSLIVCQNTAFAQNAMDASDVIRLYEQTKDSNSVPVITCIDLHQDGTLLAIGGDDHVVRLWDVQKRHFVLNLQEHLDWVRGLAFSPDRTRLATIGQDGQIKLWNAQNGQLLLSLKDPVRGTQKVAFHPSGNYFAVCGFDENIRLYDAINGNQITSLVAHGKNNKAIAFSADGTLLAVGGRSGVVRVWPISAENPAARDAVDIKGDGRRVHAIAFNSDASRLAVGGDGPFISLWNPKTGKLIERLPERPGKTFSLVFCGETILASGESDNAIRLWNLSTHQNTAALLGHSGTISSMVYEPASGRLISGSFDTSIRFWNVDAGVKNGIDQNINPQPVTPSAPPSFATPAFPVVQ